MRIYLFQYEDLAGGWLGADDGFYQFEQRCLSGGCRRESSERHDQLYRSATSKIGAVTSPGLTSMSNVA